MARKLLVGGVEYDDIPKALNRVPVKLWVEFEEQSGISMDAVDSQQVNWRINLAAMAFVLRRNQGETVTWEQVLEECVPEDMWIGEAESEGDEPDAPTVADGNAAANPSADSTGT